MHLCPACNKPINTINHRHCTHCGWRETPPEETLRSNDPDEDNSDIPLSAVVNTPPLDDDDSNTEPEFTGEGGESGGAGASGSFDDTSSSSDDSTDSGSGDGSQE